MKNLNMKNLKNKVRKLYFSCHFVVYAIKYVLFIGGTKT